MKREEDLELMEDPVSGGKILEPILRTKLHRPQLDADLVDRGRLIESLLGDQPVNEALQGELTLCRGYISWQLGEGAASLQLVDPVL